MKINAILIDPTRQLVEAITMNNSLDGFYKAIHCDCIASYGSLRNGDVATGDDNALFNAPVSLFWFAECPYPLGGRVVITSVDEDGECQSAHSTVAQIRAQVRFVPEADTQTVFAYYFADL